jgi:hypothetical protein
VGRAVVPLKHGSEGGCSGAEGGAARVWGAWQVGEGGSEGTGTASITENRLGEPSMSVCVGWGGWAGPTQGCKESCPNPCCSPMLSCAHVSYLCPQWVSHEEEEAHPDTGKGVRVVHTTHELFLTVI